MLVMAAEMSVQAAARVTLGFERPRFSVVVDLLAEGYDPSVSLIWLLVGSTH
jgi:hypothetical protein